MEDAWCRNWSTSFNPKRSQSHSQSRSQSESSILSTSISPILSAQIRVQAKAQAWHQARARVPAQCWWRHRTLFLYLLPQQPCNWKPQSRGHASKCIRRGRGFSQQYSYACRYCTASPGWSPPCSWYGGQGDKCIDMMGRVLNPTLQI